MMHMMETRLNERMKQITFIIYHKIAITVTPRTYVVYTSTFL